MGTKPQGLLELFSESADVALGLLQLVDACTITDDLRVVKFMRRMTTNKYSVFVCLGKWTGGCTEWRKRAGRRESATKEETADGGTRTWGGGGGSR